MSIFQESGNFVSFVYLNDIAVAAGGKQVFTVGRDVEVAGMDAGGLITYLCQGPIFGIHGKDGDAVFFQTVAGVEVFQMCIRDRNNMQRLPALFGVKEDKSFGSEREILYQVLFDMRQDVTDLKKLVHEIMAERGTVANPAVATSAYYTPATPAVVPPVTSSAVSYTHLDCRCSCRCSIHVL